MPMYDVPITYSIMAMSAIHARKLAEDFIEGLGEDVAATDNGRGIDHMFVDGCPRECDCNGH